MAGFEPLVFQSVWVAAAVLVVVFIGAIVQAGLGMGFGLTVAPILALLDPALVPASALYLGMSTALWGAVSERSGIVWREVVIGMAGRSTGILLGLFVLLYLLDQAMFSLIFGLIILGAVSISVAGWSIRLTTGSLISMGVISGFTGVITSVGAPPLALIYQGQPPNTARPTLATFFAIGGFLSLLALYSSGWANIGALYGALFMAPAAVLGTWAGRKVRGRFDARYRHLLLAIAALASVLLIIRGLG